MVLLDWLQPGWVLEMATPKDPTICKLAPWDALVILGTSA
jgi:hypothetical protein